ncbi:MAG: hypothetical protein F6K31_04530 [Symploca sp. SIO2G7]|nr:hypothetical protein [Symploca sp. SIO2G7]
MAYTLIQQTLTSTAVICHLSFVICHLSFVICHLSFVVCCLRYNPAIH